MQVLTMLCHCLWAMWYFDAVKLNSDDKEESSKIRLHQGRRWQQYTARVASKLEKWYANGQQNQVEFTIINNIGKTVPYVVFTEGGNMYQKAVGGGMIGNAREVWRAPS